mmetsp:Transcript_41406/g.54490  ORF Transcript_41406/g.54490 Transcript_41406/m.54490 type:complete len:80 (-) Transcript_41406:2175-2414(-)
MRWLQVDKLIDMAIRADLSGDLDGASCDPLPTTRPPTTPLAISSEVAGLYTVAGCSEIGASRLQRPLSAHNVVLIVDDI